jgi:Ala-tRNA(Pro) deacylase
MLWEENLAETPDLYLEAGDHRELIHIRAGAFMKMMAKAMRSCFSLLS